MTADEWKRRDILQLCVQLCLTGSGLAILEACAPGLHYVMAKESGGKLVVPKSEFEPTSHGKAVKSFLLVKPNGSGFPILLNRTTDDTYDAILLRCTHQGCEVGVEGQSLACPCHGSEFSLAGVVTRGPAEKNLQSFKITEDNDNVYIWLR